MSEFGGRVPAGTTYLLHVTVPREHDDDETYAARERCVTQMFTGALGGAPVWARAEMGSGVWFATDTTLPEDVLALLTHEWLLRVRATPAFGPEHVRDQVAYTIMRPCRE